MDEADEADNTVIAIDLGTSYSTVGVYRDGCVEIFPNVQNNRRTPSYVAFTDNGRRLIGEAAKNQVAANPRNTIFNIKRLIGRRFDDEAVQKSIGYLPYNVVERNRGVGVEVTVKGQTKIFTPEEISAMILSELKRVAEAHIGHKVTRAVISVPAYFYDAQRQATKDAGAIAGFEAVCLINEPTAAALASGLIGKPVEGTILVFNFGGGFISTSVLSISGSVYEVLGTSGSRHFGGEDFNRPLIDFVLQQYQGLNGVDLSNDPRAMVNLALAVEKAKLSLSSEPSTTIVIGSIFGTKVLSINVTRAQFEEWNKYSIDLIQKILDQGLANASKTKAEIDHVIVAGGSSRIPAVASALGAYFDSKKIVHDIIDCDEVVAYGASFENVQATGASETPNICVIDACTRALNLQGPVGTAVQIIAKDTSVPFKIEQILTNSEDNQTSISVKVFEGEKSINGCSNQLATFNLSHIQPLLEGERSYHISFDMDQSGILHASALNKDTGHAERLETFYSTARLSDQDIEQMKNELHMWD